MPINTEHFMLEAFLDGDSYSALADKRRFSTIDNQLNMMAEIIEDGVINGWEITPLTFPNVQVTKGAGFIDGYYVTTLDDQTFELDANSTFNFYAQHRVGITGTIGPRSDVESVSYVDTSAPATPVGFSAATGTSDAAFSVDLEWTANTEADLDHYQIYRSIDPSVGFSSIASVSSPNTSYTDSTVDEDTLYYYRLYAVDQSEFASGYASDSITTELSEQLPPNPSSVAMLHSESAINILWKRPSIDFENIKEWLITCVVINNEQEEDASTKTQRTVNKELYDYRINNLDNGETYKVTIQTVDSKDRLSTGFSLHVIPQPSSAPQDPILLDLTQSQQVEDQIIFNLEWTDGADEYDPLIPYAYKIYLTVGDQEESMPIFTFNTDYQLELYTLGDNNQKSIPENTLVTLRLTALTSDGIESFGMYTRFVTDRYGQPLPVANLSSDFNSDTGKLTVTWDNQPDTSNVFISVFDEALDGTYSGIIIDQSIGFIEQYVFDAELNHRYTITITPYDVDDVAGPPDTTVELTLIAGGVDPPFSPVSIFSQPGDRQIRLSWDKSSSIATVSYRIYRKSGSITTTFADWDTVDTVPYTQLEFVDYGLENNSTYSYYITSIDLYGQESYHLPDGAVNLNFIEDIPRPSGILTEPDNLSVSFSGNDIEISWEALLEEFDAFVVFRSINNLHSWEEIATLDNSTNSYTDNDVPLINGYTFYYTVTKIINDSDIVVQISSVAPENSICIGELTLNESNFGTPDITCRRNIANIVDPLSEWTNQFLLTHLHNNILYNPERVDLEPELIITDWSTIDGRIFTTEETDISGTSHVVKVDGRFPQTFFSIDTTNRRLIFTESIVSLDRNGNIKGEIPQIEMRVLGVEEVQGILPNNRFDEIHARQMQYGSINLEQLPSVNHEGRIRETMLPKTFLLQRFSNHTFIVPEENYDTSKTFGESTTFYATTESDGLIAEVIDFDQEDDGDLVAFRNPHFSSTSLQHLYPEDYAFSTKSTTPSGNPNVAYNRNSDNLWLPGTVVAFSGISAGTSFDTYLRVQINAPAGSGVQSSDFLAHFLGAPGGNTCNISILDPSDVPSTVELSSANAAGIRAAGNLDNLTIPWTVVPPGVICGTASSPDVSELVQAFINTPQYFPGSYAIFKLQHVSPVIGSALSVFPGVNYFACDAPLLNLETVRGLAEVTSDVAFQSEKSYHFNFQFKDTTSTRWCRVTTYNTPIKPNPIIDLKKRLRFKMLLESGSLYVCLGVRETGQIDATTGSNGGTTGPIEWVGAESFVTDVNGNYSPVGKLVEGKVGEWQEIEFDLEKDNIISFEDGDNLLDGYYGVLEHLAFTIVPESTGSTDSIDVYIDKIEQVDDVLAAGSSQGILVSRDFGSSWETSRLTETPVHDFYHATNNRYLWAISANEVLLSVDPANWFSTSGLTGTQYIRDITEDELGNMFVSTDKGVFWFEIALISTFASWRQTQPINAFTTDCYAMYHNPVSSGIDEIWVSTEIGIYKTTDNGVSWVDTDMTTQGLPSFKFINISSDHASPNIIAITRKHILRKLGSESNFSVIANLEVQHNIFDIWKMEYFAGRLYISTGQGIYSNALDELFDPSPITIPFERVFPGLEFNGTVGVAFGLDAVEVDSPQGTTNQLFIGQENRLMMSDENNTLSIKKQFLNKEIPSFFADDDELTIGYIYNSFNNVLIFREPQPINVYYKAAYLPRKIYLPINGSWSQTNPEADIFIYVNGIPKWLDFKLDQDLILSEVQTIQGTLLPLRGTLNSFNSLYPESEQYLESTLSDIVNIVSGGEGKGTVPLINNSTIVQFLDDYTRFVSLLTSDFISNANIDTNPQIILLGFSRQERETNSRAEELENKEDFTSNESTGIIVDAHAGEVDFLTIYTQTTNLSGRLEFVFNKYDKLEISIFNANISNTGELTHRELEDGMEEVNTGLSSGLSRVNCTNLIKAGIFLERNHHGLFNAYNVSNVQSKYNASYNNNWYDIYNSTVDYNIIESEDNHPESRFCNTTHLFSENPYLAGRIWIGTNNDILQYTINANTGDIELEKIVRPGDGLSPMFIWDIFVLTDDEDDIYVVAEDQDSEIGHIYRTTDSGNSWEDLETINVPSKIYKFAIISGNKVVTTENGVFYSDNTFGTWFPVNVSPSAQISANSSSLESFGNRILHLDQTTFLVTESNRWFYTSGSGIDWFAVSGQLNNNNAQVVNKIVRFKNITWVATDRGLYNDGNSLLSDSAQFGLQLIESTASNSDIPISDIAHGLESIYCSGISIVYRFMDNEWSKYEISDIVGIHKILLCPMGVKDFLIVIAHNTIQVLDVTDGEGIFDG